MMLITVLTIIICMMIGELGTIVEASVVLQPPSNCTRQCGDIPIPYPFGLMFDDEGCAMYHYFGFLFCNKSHSPPKLYFGYLDFEVIDVQLSTGQMRVLNSMSYDCYDNSSDNGARTWNVTLADTGYALSQNDNVFTAVGCDTEAHLMIGPDTYGGCISGCNNPDDVVDGQCLGIGCCQSSIPRGNEQIEMNFNRRNSRSGAYLFNKCSYAFLVEKNNYTFSKSDVTYMDPNKRFPMIFDWYIGKQSCEEAKNETSYACVSENSECFNSTNGPGYICNCSPGYEGNPYLLHGCKDIDECQLSRNEYPCRGNCVNTNGSYNCNCDAGYFSPDPKMVKCNAEVTKSNGHLIAIGVTIGVGVAVTFLIMITVGTLLYRRTQRRKLLDLRLNYFMHNHGLLIEQQTTAHPGVNVRTQFFPIIELEKATNNFDDVRIIGQGGHGVVYKGLLSDQRVVAIKKPKLTDDNEVIQLINEIILLSPTNHCNVVQLVGCCLENEVPLLVYEFVAKGTLHEYLHKQVHPLSWDGRLRIATEIIRGLVYLHSASNTSIWHRDVKSSNILLDDHLTVKISDFGASKTKKFGETHITTGVQGTWGYLDPEYLHTGHLTEKSDVYSFGAILVELLTRKIPYLRAGPNEEHNVTAQFLWSVRENCLNEIVDPDIMENRWMEEIQEVAQLAMCCLKFKGEDRPTMKEVEMKLELLLRSRN